MPGPGNSELFYSDLNGSLPPRKSRSWGEGGEHSWHRRLLHKVQEGTLIQSQSKSTRGRGNLVRKGISRGENCVCKVSGGGTGGA